MVTGKRPREEEDLPQAEASTSAASATVAASIGNDEDDDGDEEDGGQVDDMPVSHEIVLKDHAKVRHAVSGLGFTDHRFIPSVFFVIPHSWIHIISSP